ncbi:MAG TPA: UvrD-helicase domain-containing protein [Verrucomicrobiae bacterium]|jgi:ATP-dependent helicase/nuclease subunit A|nr:UvrD-helicase domain-containing protein [Verrucomicrobiae bacterium]
MSFTPAQQKAIAARGNVLVVAGAGTGKTSTLVERCLDCLISEKPPASLDQILMVTFTDAAAAEMRHRIRARLEEELAKPGQHGRWEEQLALFETAHIGTLHSFCLQLVKQHFYELELDPQLNVLAEEEAKLLADETLEDIFQAHYAGETPNAAAVQELIQKQARGWDLPIRTLVLKLHHYMQTLRNPQGWFDEQLAMLNSAKPAQWQTWLIEGVVEWRNRWLPALQNEKENLKAIECGEILNDFPEQPSREDCADMLGRVSALDGDWPKGKKEKWRKPFVAFFSEAVFLRSLARTDGKNDPLAQDWDWMRGKMATLLGLAQEFTKQFSDAKRELGAVDFHDLEQHALELLVERATGAPKATAREWREKLRFVFVDEYQDINDAQDAILKALSRDGEGANRFLVGDVKQSIYRFRLADPHIFQNYVDTWSGDEGNAIPLVDNFRSREAILDFVNSVFGALMRREIGSVPYDEKARLKFGDPENRAALSVAANPGPCVELRLRLQGGEAEATDTEGGRAWNEMVNLEESAKEARLTALRLRELKNAGHLVWDNETKKMRPVEWGDMAVLLRSPSGKVESYAREFTRLGVPLQVARGGFYESLEITDLLSLLQVLDNPLQDIPTLAVLRSPLVGMSLDELAAIRLTAPKSRCWTALQRFHETSRSLTGWEKVERFLKNYARWRNLARQVSLSRCLAAVLDETHYAAWLLTQARGEQRHANVQRLLTLAQQFDQFQRQGLFRFLHFIEAQQAAETEPQVAAVSGENSVSLMSIHQSKGLEFPVVVAGDLGKPFNLLDLHAEIILDERYGLCPQIKPPHTGQHYPSLPYWLARQRQKQEMLGEEMRLLYVAATRARDLLILTGNLPAKKYFTRWSERATVTTASLLAARNYLDWLAAWAAQNGSSPGFEKADVRAGENKFWRWQIFEDLDARLLEGGVPGAVAEEKAEAVAGTAWTDLRARLTWKYPHEAATMRAAKTSVSALRRQQEEEDADEAEPLFPFKIRGRKSGAKKSKLSASEIGTAHHTFLEFASLAEVGSLIGLRAEARRMGLEEVLSAEEIAALDFDALSAFWQSEMGKDIRAVENKMLSQSADGGAAAPPCYGRVWRELAFTARFSPGELRSAMDGELPEGEFVVVQGVADLAVILPEEIWLVDFKTDELTAAELPARVKTYELQLKLYTQALGRIYKRPVTRVCLHFLALRRSEMLKF